ncbi:hypothetical protein E8E13_003373 [Curvularia kusanoi]|uniref:tRNA(Phe) (4-demethylwyosine(37)-C(7)) aminocarboxypropyltransferase n=1 Tax=Curvularia kusanoi TaxID=90978 RepID=A0A9P4T5M1_CURKU|nr:hypothetical protein E8E13_003373 [Curvularia kusanoi]
MSTSLQPTDEEDLLPKTSNGARIVVLVPKSHVKSVKTLLEKHAIFDKQHGISPEENNNVSPKDKRMRIATTLPCSLTEDGCQPSPGETQHLETLHLHDICADITYTTWIPPTSNTSLSKPHNPLLKALRQALNSLSPCTLTALNSSVDDLVSSFPDSYSIYPPLLLLPSNTLRSPWPTLLTTHPHLLPQIWTSLAGALQITHIALNSPIPPSNSPLSAHARDSTNTLRSPVHLIPLHGSFGPLPTPQTLSQPSPNDFSTALWATARQNGITQVWAPLYTMFSRGNVKEKARILHHPSISSSITSSNGAGVTAVDLYAGIGYFAFSYRAAGVGRVLCWELNPWSVEGLCRGAALNNWTARVFSPADVPGRDAGDAEWAAWREGVCRGTEDFWVFAMSNEFADRVLATLRDVIPPIRHVNLGLLPVSRPSWPTAVGAVDSELGGWVHAHENVGVEEMEGRTVEVESVFQGLSDAVGDGAAGRDTRGGKKVRVEHVERVKMYAPGVVHAVFDVHIPGIARNTDNE